MLLQFSKFFLLFLLLTQHHPLPQAIPKAWFMSISSLATPFPILYLTSLWLFCNYLFVRLNPLTSLSMPPHTPPIWQPSTCSPYP